MIISELFTPIVTLVRHHPELLIFLSLSIGYLIGKIEVAGFSLGATASVLLVALFLGQFDVVITPLIKSIAFTLFIFTIGYKVGPQFFGGLKKDGLQYVLLSLFVAIAGLITAFVLAKLFGFNRGTTAGLLAGAMTQSSIIGTAEGTLRTLALSAIEKRALESDIAIAYAITYIFGVAGLILFYKVVPRMLHMDLKQEAQKLATQMSGKKGQTSAASSTDHTTDLVVVGLGCFLGTLLGLVAIDIGFVSLTLGVGGGVLLLGILFGWLHSKWPHFGHIPPAAEWLLSDLGLNIFIACIGLTAGPRALHALQSQGMTLFAAGVILTLTPHILGLLFGRFILRLNPVLLVGALAGAGTATPSLNVLKNECGNATPAIGYTVPYALGNFILTMWGTVVVTFM